MSELKVTDLYPPQEVTFNKRPYCDSFLSRYCVERNREWAAREGGVPRRMKKQIDEGHPIEKCGHYARYSINGKYYCRKHGSLIALDLVAKPVTA